MIFIETPVKLIGSGTGRKLYLPKSSSEFRINRRCHHSNFIDVVDAVKDDGIGAGVNVLIHHIDTVACYV